ncbi:MAG: hypothetical protein BWY87_01273 [Deltaproteobacteria bacterium ADurb.Bin510]|nr:MAG: hypothetical protein BWY87_01273 [Deltaproteobacteria bacterium ADurb.Bin510]
MTIGELASRLRPQHFLSMWLLSSRPTLPGVALIESPLRKIFRLSASGTLSASFLR